MGANHFPASYSLVRFSHDHSSAVLCPSILDRFPSATSFQQPPLLPAASDLPGSSRGMSLPSRLEGFEYRGRLFLSGPTGDKEGHSQLCPEAHLAFAFTKLVQRPQEIFTLQLWHSPARASAFYLQAFTPKKAKPLGEWQSHHWALEP